MKLKIYNLALAALMSLAVNSIAVAQNATPAPPVAPIAPVASVAAVAPNQEVGVYTDNSTPQDSSTYKTKMKKLQDQVRALTREMGELAREQGVKATAAVRERTEAIRKVQAERFDSTFSRTFNQNFASNINANVDHDANLQKQIASGDVKEKSKAYSKSYPVDANDELAIDNRYGKITVTTWAKNEVKVDVDIKAYSMDDADAQKLIDQTSINSEKGSNIVSFKTDIDMGKNSWWGSSSENGKITKVHKVVINYTVYMPAKNDLTITNRYGQVVLPNLDGKVNITNSYGGLLAKALTNNDNVIVVKYGDANITSLNGGNLNVAYGKLAIESADKLTANIAYTTTQIGKLTTSGNIDIKYGGGLSIGDLGRQLKSLTVNSAYTPLKLASVSDINADFDVTVHYAEFMYNNAVKVTSQSPDKERGYTPTKSYKGQIGRGSNDKTITINSKYGGVKFD